MTTPEQVRALLGHPEGSRAELKSATVGFHFEKLVTYCVALANEGGGPIVLGVTDRRPRQVVGTLALAAPRGGTPDRSSWIATIIRHCCNERAIRAANGSCNRLLS